MIVSRYEEVRNKALRAVRRAICENRYLYDNEYIVIIENITNDYNVEFTYTKDGRFADKIFDEDCDVMRDCALAHIGDEYITVLAKCSVCGYIEVIKEQNSYFNKR